jgi:hypothetical protein
MSAKSSPFQCAGQNRHEAKNESALLERSSEAPGLQTYQWKERDGSIYCATNDDSASVLEPSRKSLSKTSERARSPVLQPPPHVEYVRHGRDLPSWFPSMDFNSVPLV